MKTIKLEFADSSTIEDLSCVCQGQGFLWLASDETTAVERLRPLGPNRYGGHVTVHLAPLLKLKRAGEIDIEGIDFRDGRLWVVGSHSAKRLKPSSDKPDEKNIERLATVLREQNRFLLACFNVSEAGDLELAFAVRDVYRLLRRDVHIGPFAQIPSKDNGLDVEGLAVHKSGRIFIGLRGPVLRGWATVIEVVLSKKGKLRGLNKHFLQMDGLGLRELVWDKDDLLVLAGPTMDLDGPVRVFRWKNAAGAQAEQLVWRKELDVVLEVPHGYRADHAEGMTIIDEGGARSLLVVYDSPKRQRVRASATVAADLLPLPGGGKRSRTR